MVKKLPGIFLIVFVTIIIIDLYVYSGFLWFIQSFNNQLLKFFCSAFYWLIPLFFAVTFGITMYKFIHSRSPLLYSSLFRYVGLFILIYIPKITFLFFLLLQDIVTLIYIGISAVFNFENSPVYNGLRDGIFSFISISGSLLSVLIFLVILYGIIFGRFNFKVRRILLSFKTLPDTFDGFRIIHVSDLHAGSIGRLKHKMMKAIRLINAEKPDLILFSGDMVNDFAGELDGWEEVFTGLKATHGKFSILGNHDYGEYYPWNDPDEKKKNIEEIIDKEKKMGFRILLNESEFILRNGQQIAIVGVENWGLPPFRQYGDLHKALSDVPDDCFKILLSHDPSHWDEEVAGKTDINLTLSGHTHGFQFGIRAGRFRWSPVKLKYPRWEGLHRVGNQYLYVNTGVGYIGFPGRIGIPPEIVVFELRKN